MNWIDPNNSINAGWGSDNGTFYINSGDNLLYSCILRLNNIKTDSDLINCSLNDDTFRSYLNKLTNFNDSRFGKITAMTRNKENGIHMLTEDGYLVTIHKNVTTESVNYN